jgi:hypothetical protein
MRIIRGRAQPITRLRQGYGGQARLQLGCGPTPKVFASGLPANESNVTPKAFEVFVAP